MGPWDGMPISSKLHKARSEFDKASRIEKSRGDDGLVGVDWLLDRASMDGRRRNE